MEAGECDLILRRCALVCTAGIWQQQPSPPPSHALPCPALRRPALGINLLASPLCSSLSLAAARHPSSRGFPGRGCDGTCHGTVEPGPVDVPGVPGVPGYPVQHEWVCPLQSIQVPERHGNPTQRTTPFQIRDKAGEAPNGCTRYIDSTVSEDQQRQSLELSSPAQLSLQQAAVVFVFASSSQPLGQSVRRSAEIKKSATESPVVGGTTIGPPDWVQRRPPSSRHPHQLLSLLNPNAPWQLQLQLEVWGATHTAPRPVDPAA